jgi:hypothetical protein
MGWLIPALFLLALLLVILLTRLRIIIDSYGGIAKVSWGRVVHLFLTQSGGMPVLRLRLFGWTRDWLLLELFTGNHDSGNHDKTADRSRKRRKKGRRNKFSFRRILRLINSFKVNAFKLELDTDDYVLNAWLFPAMELLRYRGVDISVNFNGMSGLRLDISNTPARWLK